MLDIYKLRHTSWSTAGLRLSPSRRRPSLLAGPQSSIKYSHSPELFLAGNGACLPGA
jgi:hypothetical protein